MESIFDTPVLASRFQDPFGIGFQAGDVETSFDGLFTVTDILEVLLLVIRKQHFQVTIQLALIVFDGHKIVAICCNDMFRNLGLGPNSVNCSANSAALPCGISLSLEVIVRCVRFGEGEKKAPRWGRRRGRDRCRAGWVR